MQVISSMRRNKQAKGNKECGMASASLKRNHESREMYRERKKN